MVSREVFVGRYRGNGPQEPQWSECIELVHLLEGTPELAELDKEIAAKKARRAEWANSEGRYEPTSPAYEPSSPRSGY